MTAFTNWCFVFISFENLFHRIYKMIIDIIIMEEQEDSEPFFEHYNSSDNLHNTLPPMYTERCTFTSELLIRVPKGDTIYEGRVIRKRYWFHTEFVYQRGNENTGFNTVLKTNKILNGYDVIARCEDSDISIACIERNIMGSRYLLIEKDFTCCHRLCNISIDVNFEIPNSQDGNNKVDDVFEKDSVTTVRKCNKECKHHMKPRETFAVEYEQRILNHTGPRRMKAFFTGLDDQDMPKLSTRLKKKQFDKIIHLTNKLPEYNYNLGSYMLNFRGRVTEPSVKNFQLIHPMSPDIVYLTFGKTGDNMYVLDFMWPLNCVQAFFFAITALDFKIGCE